jgi:hypothetical protein
MPYRTPEKRRSRCAAAAMAGSPISTQNPLRYPATTGCAPLDWVVHTGSPLMVWVAGGNVELVRFSFSPSSSVTSGDGVGHVTPYQALGLSGTMLAIAAGSELTPVRQSPAREIPATPILGTYAAQPLEVCAYRSPDTRPVTGRMDRERYPGA